MAKKTEWLTLRVEVEVPRDAEPRLTGLVEVETPMMGDYDNLARMVVEPFFEDALFEDAHGVYQREAPSFAAGVRVVQFATAEFIAGSSGWEVT